MATEGLTTWTGADLAEFLEAHNLSPEQCATALCREPLTIRNWMKAEGPFTGTAEVTHVMRLAILGIIAEAKNLDLSPARSGPPIKVELLVYPTGAVRAAQQQMARDVRLAAGSSREFVDVPS